MTLWQGTLGAYGFLAQALATARAALGLFIPIQPVYRFLPYLLV